MERGWGSLLSRIATSALAFDTESKDIRKAVRAQRLKVLTVQSHPRDNVSSKGQPLLVCLLFAALRYGNRHVNSHPRRLLAVRILVDSCSIRSLWRFFQLYLPCSRGWSVTTNAPRAASQGPLSAR